jgi:hypothetical protein
MRGFFNTRKQEAAVRKQITTFEIPKLIHFIWFGSMLNDRHQPHIINTKKQNPDYQIFIHTDSKTMKIDDYKKLQEFCQQQGINLVNLADAKEDKFSNLCHILPELGRKKWARASDLARMTILYLHGGIYLDTDLQPFKGFGTLRCKTGMLQFISPKPEDCKAPVVNIYFMAAIPRHPIYQACIKSMNWNYQLANTFADKEKWMNSDDGADEGEICKIITAYLTGAALQEVIYGSLNEKWLTHIKFGLESFVKIVLDGSWHASGPADMEARKAFFAYAAKSEELQKAELSKLCQQAKLELNALVRNQSVASPAQNSSPSPQ